MLFNQWFPLVLLQALASSWVGRTAVYDAICFQLIPGEVQTCFAI